ncbi:MAG: ATP-binding protein [Omnitrophica WOR_2 bacterium]
MAQDISSGKCASLLDKRLIENNLTLALKALKAGVWYRTAPTDEITWDEKCYELFDIPHSVITLDEWIQKVEQEDRAQLLQILTNNTVAEEFTMEFRITVKDKIRWIRISASFIPSKNNSPEYTTGVMIDVTDEKYLHQKLHDDKFTKDRFFSVIAHDLRSPFTSILGFSRLLNEEYDDFSNEERKMMIKQILSSTEITFQLLDNLLTWAKTQLGGSSFTPEYFDIETMILESVNLAVPQARIKGITLKISMLNKSKVYADANMIKTVLRNLLSNAVKFSYENSEVNIEASSIGDYIKVSISDHGTGIEPRTMKILFCLDEKVSSTKGTANEKGTGLGLILCKDFVEKNGGTIAFESKLGEGSKFSFTIPVKEQ